MRTALTTRTMQLGFHGQAPTLRQAAPRVAGQFHCLAKPSGSSRSNSSSRSSSGSGSASSSREGVQAGPAGPAQFQRSQAQLMAKRGTTAAAVATAEAPAATSTSGAVEQQRSFKFACPICQSTEFEVELTPSPYQRLSCGRCNRTFEPRANFLDLTLTSGAPQKVYNQQFWRGTELFRQPFVSFLYERGWRQNFAMAGFPGPEAEFDISMRYLAPVLGGTLVDASCGTGMFSRLFARSGKFSGVVALDYSESMLQQAQEYFRTDTTLATSTPIVCLRADIGRLPFATGSVDAIHAGAAIHCWPNPQAALAEISRVLRPGGVFVASTFLTPLAPLGAIIGDDTVRPFSQNLNPFGRNNNTFRYWEEDELIDLLAAVGLSERYERTRQRQFILFAATKPGSSDGN